MLMRRSKCRMTKLCDAKRRKETTEGRQVEKTHVARRWVVGVMWKAKREASAGAAKKISVERSADAAPLPATSCLRLVSYSAVPSARLAGTIRIAILSPS